MAKQLDYFSLLGMIEKAGDQSDNEKLFRGTLQTVMNELGLSCREVAEGVKTTSNTIRRWLKGESSPNKEMKERVMRHLDNVLHQQKRDRHRSK